MDKTLNTGLQAWRSLGGGVFALIVSEDFTHVPEDWSW